MSAHAACMEKLWAVWDLLFPACCPSCGVPVATHSAEICDTCLAQLPSIHAPCPECGAPRESAQADCQRCSGHGLSHINEMVVAYHYHGVMDRLILSAKAHGSSAAVRALAGLAPPAPAVDLVTAIPPNPGRRRGPHLASTIARAIAKRTSAPYRRLLSLNHAPARQHELTPADRRRNVAALFACRSAVPKRVLLVDDILTTGTTLMSAARALKHAGCQHVVALCIARTPLPDERTTLDADNQLDAAL